MGVNASWPLLNKIAPCVPFFGAVVEHVEESFQIRHSSRHSVPKAEIDILAIMNSFGKKGGSIFEYKSDRKVTSEKKEQKDCFLEGTNALQNTHWFEDWFEER